MKKIIIAGIGVLLVSGAFIFTSGAQNTYCNCFVDSSTDTKTRYKSKGCCADAKRPIRAFSDRIGPWRYREYSHGTQNRDCEVARPTHASGRKDTHLYSQYRKSSLTRAQKIAYQRQVFGQTNGGRYLNTQAADRNYVRTNDYLYKTGVSPQDQVVQTEPEDFAMAVPRNFVKKDGVYRSANSTFAFRVVSGGTCNAIAFADCVDRLEAKFQEENKFTRVYSETTSHRWNQTVLANFDYFQTVTKSYNAVAGGKHNSYFTFTTLNPTTNEVVRIEGVSTAREQSTAAQQAHDLFESFRFQFS